MQALAYTPDALSTADAAKILAVSEHQVRELVKSNELASIKGYGGRILLSPNSVMTYRQTRQSKGRPLKAEVAFAALGAISGMEANLDYAQKRRLNIKLESISAEELVWQTRRRKQTWMYRCSESFLPELKAKLSLSGISATEENFDLTENQNMVEGYIDQTELGQLEDEFFLQAAFEGNVKLHVAEALPWHESTMPIGVVAADLAESLNAREHAAGISKLEELLHGYRNNL